METGLYETYNKPPLSPPPYLFGIVWSILYTIIIISYGFVFYNAFKRRIPWKITLPFILNLIANLAYTYIQFNVQNFTLATIDVFLVLLTIVWSMVIIWPCYRWVAYAQIPYLLWVLFATYLQISITILN